MSSLFDIPAGLMFVLSLVASAPSQTAHDATGLAFQPTSAAGSVQERATPCRFTDQAWLAALKNGAGGVAYAGLARRIFKTSAGRYYVPSRSHRSQIFRLRHDQAASCFIALSAAAANGQRIREVLEIDAGLTELYLAHVFGPAHTVRLLKAIKEKPTARMARLFPNIDQRARGLFAGKAARMTMAGFSKRLKQAIRTKVAEAAGKHHKRRAVRSAKTRKTVARSKRVHQAKVRTVSARDVNRSAIRILNPSKPDVTQKRVEALYLSRFRFARGMVRDQDKNTAQTPVEIAF